MEQRHYVELIQEHQVKTTQALQRDKITCTISKIVSFYLDLQRNHARTW
jgi:hypothetical protein